MSLGLISQSHSIMYETTLVASIPLLPLLTTHPQLLPIKMKGKKLTSLLVAKDQVNPLVQLARHKLRLQRLQHLLLMINKLYSKK